MEIKALYKKFLKHKQISAPKSKVQSKKPIAVSSRGLWDKNKKKVIVPSNRITMKGPNGEQDFFKRPVLATGLQSGKQVMMQPGGEYYFPKDRAVVEKRMQGGGWYNESQWDAAVNQAALDNLPKVTQNKVGNPALSVSASEPRGLGYSTNPSINKQRPSSPRPNSQSKPTEQPSQSEEVDITDAVKGLRPEEPKFSGVKNVLNKADLVTDVMQMGHFIPHPVGQAVGYVGDVLGAGVDLAQSGINIAEGDYEGAAINAALGVLPGVTGKQGYKRSNSLINHTTPGTHRPLTALPHLRNNPVVKRGLMWNRATLGANALEVGSNLNLDRQNTSSDRYQDNSRISQDNTRMSPNIRPVAPKMQKGGTVDPEFMFKDKYNTELTPSEEAEFYAWAAKESERQGRDILNDIGAYDVKGFWKSGDYENMDSDNHGSDTWKKPNHPTFSNQSKYHGADGWYGGNWTDKAGYQPSKQTLETYGPEYYDWMFKAEPGRDEYLDMSRYESGRNAPTPFVYQDGGTVQTSMLQPIKKDEDSLPILMDSLFSQFQKTKQEFGAQPEEELQMQDGGHVISSGETFYGIANKYGLDKDALLTANPGLDIDKIMPGQKLNLPVIEKIEEVNVSSKNKREPTKWYNYINPLNWGAPNYDDAGAFGKAFRKARAEGEGDFMYYGKRYSSDLAKLPDSKKAVVSDVEEGEEEEILVKDTVAAKPKPKPIQKTKPQFTGNQLDLDNVIDYLVATRGGNRDTWKGMADTIAYHESAHSMDPKQKQIGGGPGRGMFQFEDPTFKTFKNRYKNVSRNLKLETDPAILAATSADQLTPKQQYTAFLVNMSQSKAPLREYSSGRMSLEDIWLKGHKNVEKKGDRKSFQTSINKAKKRGIKGGSNTFQMGGTMSIPGVNGTVVASSPSLYNKYKSGGQHGGLDRWFAEKWVDVKTGKDCGRSGTDKDGRPYPACRPSKRISSKTPKTSSEMSSSEKAKFKATKTSSQRIPYNHKRK